jgi:hypothetical protein
MEQSNELLDYVNKCIVEKSQEAISRGNKFPGFLGFPPEHFSDESLIMLLNIVWDELQSERLTLNEYSKRLTMSL